MPDTRQMSKQGRERTPHPSPLYAFSPHASSKPMALPPANVPSGSIWREVATAGQHGSRPCSQPTISRKSQYPCMNTVAPRKHASHSLHAAPHGFFPPLPCEPSAGRPLANRRSRPLPGAIRRGAVSRLCKALATPAGAREWALAPRPPPPPRPSTRRAAVRRDSPRPPPSGAKTLAPALRGSSGAGRSVLMAGR